MCRLARQYTELPVIQMKFQEMVWHGEFDGIWACASLLHVPRLELAEVLRGVLRALRFNGTLYTSFKHGTGERIVDGRLFTDMTEGELSSIQWTIG
jgi:hypothetical protein